MNSKAGPPGLYSSNCNSTEYSIRYHSNAPIINFQRLFRLSNQSTPFLKAFARSYICL